MLASELSELRGVMRNQGVMFCFSGYLTEDVLTGIGQALKRKLEADETDFKTAIGLFAIFVELVQNVIRYSAERNPSEKQEDAPDLRYGVLTVGRDKSRYFVACGNMIEPGDTPRLKQDLAHIRSLDKDGLKSLYLKTLKGETPGGSAGAGVGFIDIARRAGKGFDYDFQEMGSGQTFFAMRAFI